MSTGPSYVTVWRRAVRADAFLTPLERLAATVWADYCDTRGNGWVAVPTMAKALACDHRTARRVFVNLVARGWLLPTIAATPNSPRWYRAVMSDRTCERRTRPSSNINTRGAGDPPARGAGDPLARGAECLSRGGRATPQRLKHF